jgi:hypothetical protein
LTEKQVAVALRMYAKGESPCVIAERFAVDYDTIRRIVVPGFREKRAAQIARARKARIANPTPARWRRELAEYREKPKTSPVSLANPEPGRSALDRRKG